MAHAYKYRLVSHDEDGMGEVQQQRVGWVKRRQCRCVAVCVAVMAVINVVLCALLLWSMLHVPSSQDCVTRECVDVSAYILGKMNRSVDPCQDFYTFSCGGWLAANFLPPGRAIYDTFAEIDIRNNDIIRMLLEDESTLFQGKKSSSVAKLKSYYRTCMDIDKIEADGTAPILQKIEEVGGWSILSAGGSQRQSRRAEGWDLVSRLVTFHTMGFAPLFSFYLTVDAKNSSNHLLSFCQAGLTLDSHEEYLKDAEKFKDGFMTFAVKVGKLLGGDNSTHQKMAAIYDFERRMAQIFMDKEELNDPLATYNVMTLADFQQMVGKQLDLRTFMEGVLGEDVEDDQKLKVTTVRYFQRLGALLANTTDQVLQDYMVWHMVQLVPGYLPQAFVDAVMPLNRVERGVKALTPRWQRCVSKAQSAFTFPSAALYVTHAFPTDSKRQIDQILKAVQQAFIDNLATLPWMDRVTRARARTKANGMERALGYPDWILDPLLLDAYYQTAEVKEGEFLNSYFAIGKYESDRMWARRGKVPDRNEWRSDPAEANAFFSSTFNRIMLMAGLLQRPYFDPHYPRSFAYGSMGMISGHELTHGFDNRGRKYNAKGNLEDWWSAKSSQAFVQRSQCMVHQYNNYTWDDGTHLNGNYTLAENIADNGGLKLGFAAYLRALSKEEGQEPRLPAMHLTPQQLFFVGFAQIWCAHYTPEYARHSILTNEHTINKLRVHGSVANMPEFAEAFNCPLGSPHHPHTTCPVW